MCERHIHRYFDETMIHATKWISLEEAEVALVMLS